MTEYICTDNLEWLRKQPDNSFDSIVTDAPYGLGKEPDAIAVLRDWIDHGYHEIKNSGGFMGKSWDSFVPQPIFWKECLRVLKPGGYCLSFFGTRTYDWGVMAMRIAGFEIRDQIAWVYGSGFPKSMDVSKAIDKAMGVERGVISSGKPVKRMIPGADQDKTGSWIKDNGRVFTPTLTEPASDLAKQWAGWGTALKPAIEPIVVARKPLISTVVQNIIKHGTGAINIDDCRVDLNGDYKSKPNGRPSLTGLSDNYDPFVANEPDYIGRWPANLIHDGSEEVLQCFPESKGQQGIAKTDGTDMNNQIYGKMKHVTINPMPRIESETSAARFFYCAKTSREERNRGLKDPGAQFQHGSTLRKIEDTDTVGNNHPTVKPIALMRYLVRLATPKGGRCLDPFCGSGTTGIAAKMEWIDCVCLDSNPDYIAISKARDKAWHPGTMNIFEP